MRLRDKAAIVGNVLTEATCRTNQKLQTEMLQVFLLNFKILKNSMNSYPH